MYIAEAEELSSLVFSFKLINYLFIKALTNQQVLFELHVLLCKPQYKSTVVDESKQ